MSPTVGSTRYAVLAFLIGLGVLLVLLSLGVRPGFIVAVAGLALAPGLWWRWRTREFRHGVRALRKGRTDAARDHFQRFLADAEADDRFLRWQPFFNLGRPYDYVAGAHNNLGVLALRRGDREEARARFRTTLDRAPGFVQGHYGMAASRLIEGDLDAATEAARAGLGVEPGNRPCAILLALCHAERGDRAAAEEVLDGLTKPISWEDARSMWAKMYRFWRADERAERWT